MSTRKNYTDAPSAITAKYAAGSAREQPEYGQLASRPVPLNQLQHPSPNGKNQPAMGVHELNERDRQFKARLNGYAAKEEAETPASLIAARRDYNARIEHMRIRAASCLEHAITSEDYEALPPDAQAKAMEVDQKVAALQDTTTVPTNEP